jgi:uncharacterized protein (DUF305 family)
MLVENLVDQAVMSPARRFLLVVAVAMPFAAAACSARGTAGPAGAGPADMSPAEVEAVYRARADSARMRFTEADVRFMTGMIHHHAQAIEVSLLVPTHGASGSVRTLAARIINAQKDEIALMQAWLRDRGQPVPELHLTDTHVMGRGAGHDASMPGMLSAEQIRQLDEARGEEFDRLFLTLMIQHHRGAVVMVHELFATDGAGQDEAVSKLASDVQVDQTTEVARMERMLSALPGR